MRRVLLIDDTPEIAELLTFALQDRGYQVSVSGFSPSVSDLIVARQADALVLDLSTFDMSESVFDAVRQSPNQAAFPVVIISDTPELADASLRRRKAQKVVLVPKPFTGSQVATALEQLFE